MTTDHLDLIEALNEEIEHCRRNPPDPVLLREEAERLREPRHRTGRARWTIDGLISVPDEWEPAGPSALALARLLDAWAAKLETAS